MVCFRKNSSESALFEHDPNCDTDSFLVESPHPNQESSGEWNLKFAGEECFDRIYESISSTLADDFARYPTGKPGGTGILPETIFSICRILSETKAEIRTGPPSSQTLPDENLDVHDMQNPDPRILPCVLRCLRSWRLRNSLCDMENDRNPADDSDARSLVQLAMNLAALVNNQQEGFARPPSPVPRRLKIKWLGSLAADETVTFPSPQADSSQNNSTPQSLQSTSTQLNSSQMVLLSCDTHAAHFRNGCSACHRRRPIPCALSSCNTRDESLRKGSLFNALPAPTSQTLRVSGSRGSDCDTNFDTGCRPNPRRVIPPLPSNTRRIKKPKSTPPDENFPPLLPLRPVDPKLRNTISSHQAYSVSHNIIQHKNKSQVIGLTSNLRTHPLGSSSGSGFLRIRSSVTSSQVKLVIAKSDTPGIASKSLQRFHRSSFDVPSHSVHAKDDIRSKCHLSFSRETNPRPITRATLNHIKPDKTYPRSTDRRIKAGEVMSSSKDISSMKHVKNERAGKVLPRPHVFGIRNLAD